MNTARIMAVAALLPVLWFAGCGDKTTAPGNEPPRIIDVTARPTALVPLGSTRLTAFVADSDGDELTLSWEAAAGSFSDSSSSATNWTAPDSAGIFTITLFVTDQIDTVSQSVDVEVGSASLTVLSDPAGAFISLDGSPTGFRTPHTFDPVSPGSHVAALTNPYFEYSTATEGAVLADGQADTVRFGIQAPIVTTLDPGRGDLLEIGAIAFLPDGSGFLYQARTAAGTGLYTTSVNSRPGNGTLLRASVRLQESVAITPDGDWAIFVSETDSLFALPIDDFEGDGVIDMVGTVVPLRRNSFGPAMSTAGELAFSFTRSEDPATTPLFFSIFAGGSLPDVRFASNNAGRRPTWKPGESYIAYERDGLILNNFVSTAGPSPADTIAEDGYNAAPAWGDWGPKHVAYLHGPDAQNLTDVRLGVEETPFWATVSTALEDPRFVAWNPLLRWFAVTHHPGGTVEIVVFSNLPIP